MVVWGWKETPVMSSTSQMSLVDPKKTGKKEIIVNIHLHYMFPYKPSIINAYFSSLT